MISFRTNSVLMITWASSMLIALVRLGHDMRASTFGRQTPVTKELVVYLQFMDVQISACNDTKARVEVVVEQSRVAGIVTIA